MIFMTFLDNLVYLFNSSTQVFFGLQQFVFLVLGVFCIGVIFKIFSMIFKGRY